MQVGVHSPLELLCGCEHLTLDRTALLKCFVVSDRNWRQCCGVFSCKALGQFMFEFNPFSCDHLAPVQEPLENTMCWLCMQVTPLNGVSTSRTSSSVLGVFKGIAFWATSWKTTLPSPTRSWTCSAEVGVSSFCFLLSWWRVFISLTSCRAFRKLYGPRAK